MLVPVNWSNNHYDYINDSVLDNFIEAGVIIKFLRSSGWATIGVDPIRVRAPGTNYDGIERRSVLQAPANGPLPQATVDN